MPNQIPTRQRTAVKERDMGRCNRCGMHPENGEWHHRRSRAVHDLHTHCTCNGVWLCQTCHRWVHAHPFEARAEGYIVSRHQAQPKTVPVTSAMYGYCQLDCVGTVKRADEETPDE